LAKLKDELFVKHLQVTELDCNRGDQLTRELQHFVQCVRTGSTPRVGAIDGRDAIAVAERVLECIGGQLQSGHVGLRAA
jgi:predicted dehydrogenase